MAVVLGPILQFRGLIGNQWNVSALVVCDTPDEPSVVPASVRNVAKIAELPEGSARFHVFRFSFSAPVGSGEYAFSIGGEPGSFHVPDAGSMPRCAYVSCNGMSKPPRKLWGKFDSNERWRNLLQHHAVGSYNLLLCGGDQIYTDSMWSKVERLRKLADGPHELDGTKKWSPALQRDIDEFFCKLYIERWSQAEPANAFAHIPTVMMWDDHDIFDGWGSYPEEIHNSPVAKGLYRTAEKYFRIFQQQMADGETHPLAVPGQNAFNLGADLGGGMRLLALDLRSERQPRLPGAGGLFIPERVMNPETAGTVLDWLDAQPDTHHQIVMSSIPVCYLDLGYIEGKLASLPGRQELEDDLRDHWLSEPHRGERKRLIQRLLGFAQARSTRVTLISGDVHVGALCVVTSTRPEHTGNAAIINQLISSAVVHPATNSIVVWAMEQMANRDNIIDGNVVARMQPFAGKGGYLIPDRNWLALEPDDNNRASGRIWAKWHIEGQPDAITQVIHPVAMPMAQQIMLANR